jgi:putative membrane protein
MGGGTVPAEGQIGVPVGPARRFGRIGYAGLAVGLALFTGLLAYRGVGEVVAAVGVAGIGVFGVAAFHLVPMFADAVGWRRLLPARERPDAATMLWARWIGESVNGLLPVLQIGGNVVKARLLAERGVPGPRAGASVVVDVTLVVTSQMLFTLLGLGLLAARLGGGETWRAAAVGAVLMALALAGFHAFQRRGGFARLARRIEGMTSGEWTSLVASAGELDRAVGDLYADRRTIGAAWAWHLASWLVGVGEVWLALRCLGAPVDLPTAALLESLGQAVRASAFAVPGALGIQEGGYLALGAALGIPPTTALALSLVKRVRELVLGIPGLVSWQLAQAPQTGQGW